MQLVFMLICAVERNGEGRMVKPGLSVESTRLHSVSGEVPRHARGHGQRAVLERVLVSNKES